MLRKSQNALFYSNAKLMFQSDLSPQENSLLSSSQNFENFEKDTLGSCNPFAFNIEELEAVQENSS